MTANRFVIHYPRGCRREVSALEINDKLDIYLKGLCPNPEDVELYLVMMEATFKAKEGDRELQLSKFKSQLPNHEASVPKFD
jgi:hypothetical protein